MLLVNTIFGMPIMSDLLGIIVGHVYYFLTVLHPRAGGQEYLKTPTWVYPSNPDIQFDYVLDPCASMSRGVNLRNHIRPY